MIDEKTRKERIKDHFERNKQAYIFGGAGVAMGFVGAAIFSNKINVSQIAIGAHNTLEQTTVLVRRGHPGNIIKCIETGELFASQNRAAQSLGLNPNEVSKCVRGLKDSVGGYTFKLIGEAS